MNPSEHIKNLPYSIEAEQSVLGSLILDNQAWDKVADRISEKDFYQIEHRILFRSIAHLAHSLKPFDLVTLTESLKNTSELEKIGTEVYLFEILRNTPTATNITAYADIIRERSLLRQLIAVASEITESALAPAGREVPELIDAAERKIFQIAHESIRGDGPFRIGDLLTKTINQIEHLFNANLNQTVTGLSTGFQDLDKLTSGLQPSDLIVVAGRPSMGKTTFAMNIASYTAIRENKQPVLVFSMEMSAEALALRMMSSLGRLDQHKMRTGQLTDKDWPRVGSAVALLSGAMLFIDDTPALSPGEIRARARRLAREFPLGLIVIDYLQLMQLPRFKENRSMEISEISRSLKSLAKELHVPIIALSQLNRGLEQRTDKRPNMADLRDSGAIEQDADLIVFIYRDEVYHEQTSDKGCAEIIIAKQRNGPTGKVKLIFRGEFTLFEDFTPDCLETKGERITTTA